MSDSLETGRSSQLQDEVINGATGGKCGICHKQFANLYNLHRHIKTIHPVWFHSQMNKKGDVSSKSRKVEEFMCDLCKKCFLKNSNMLRHIRTVHKRSIDRSKTSSPEFKCYICDKHFLESCYLRKHIRNIHHVEHLFEFKPATAPKTVFIAKTGEYQTIPREILIIHKSKPNEKEPQIV